MSWEAGTNLRWLMILVPRAPEVRKTPILNIFGSMSSWKSVWGSFEIRYMYVEMEVGLEIMLESTMILSMTRSSRSPSLQTESGFTTAGYISTKFWVRC